MKMENIYWLMYLLAIRSAPVGSQSCLLKKGFAMRFFLLSSTVLLMVLIAASCAHPVPIVTPMPHITDTAPLPAIITAMPEATDTPLPPTPIPYSNMIELWRLSFENQPAGLSFSDGIAWADTLLTVSTHGVLYRIDAQTGQVQMQLLLWPEGPRGIGGARLTRVCDKLLIGLSDLFMETPRSRFSSFRMRLLLVDPRGAGRIVRDFGTAYNSSFDWRVSGRRILIGILQGKEFVAVDGQTGQMLWRYQTGRGSLLAADEQSFYVMRRSDSLVPYNEPKHANRQHIIALDAQTGQVRWDVAPTLADAVRQAVLSDDGLVLLGDTRTILALAAADGQEAWRSEIGISYFGEVVAHDGLLYGTLLSQDNVVALNLADGQIMWHASLPGYGRGTLAPANGRVYVTTTDSNEIYLHVLSATTGRNEQSIALGRISDAGYYSDLAVIGQRVFAVGKDIHAFGHDQPMAQPPPISPLTFVTHSLPALPIYYESTYSGTGNVWRALSDGSQPLNVSNGGDDNWDPSPSTDGKWIAFESYRTGTSELWLMRSDGGDQHPLTNTDNQNIYNAHPTWSPDSRSIAFASNRSGEQQIWVIQHDGSDAHLLTSEGRNVDPAWSPDGDTIVFVSNRDGNSDLWQMDADGSNQHPLTRDTQMESSPSWSPDGQRLAYVAHTRDMGSEWGQIILFDLESGLRWIAPYTHWGQDRNPSFSPDGTRLAWARMTDDPGKPQVWIMRLDAQAHPTSIENAKDPAWATPSG